MEVLLAPVGTAGDCYPYLGLAARLSSRGHDITVLANGYFAPLVRRLGYHFVEVTSSESFLAVAHDPRVWHPLQGPRIVCRYATTYVRPLYEAIVRHARTPDAVLLSSCLGWGARLAQDRKGIRLVTLDLQPSVLWSNYDSPQLPGVWKSAWAPAWWKGIQFRIGERLLLDPVCCPPLNAFRRELGLAPIRRMTQWWHSPECILGMFPAWFAPRQPDWPRQLHLTQFPLWNEESDAELPPDISEFLADGDPPIVFAPGSGNVFGHRFFQQAVAACQQSGRRGMLMTRFNDHVPARLPTRVRHFPYASFSRLLPRVAAIVHHGGIGTTSHALAAGIPQIIHPFSHDQPDNARRVVQLGVGRCLAGRRFQPGALVCAWDDLLSDQQVRTRCQALARRIAQADPFEESCRVIESLRDSTSYREVRPSAP